MLVLKTIARFGPIGESLRPSMGPIRRGDNNAPFTFGEFWLRASGK